MTIHTILHLFILALGMAILTVAFLVISEGKEK
jgi:hypothetical protein